MKLSRIVALMVFVLNAIAMAAASSCSREVPSSTSDSSTDVVAPADTPSNNASPSPSSSSPAPPDDDGNSEPEPCELALPNHRCGLAPQCGCASNETCVVTEPVAGTTSCVTAGHITLGRPCEQASECSAGLTCMYGACRPYCAPELDTCSVPGADLCVRVDGWPSVGVCTVACDPRFPQAACGSNTCIWFPELYPRDHATDCDTAGLGASHDSCADDYDCGPGLACIDSECAKWCRVGEAGDCDDGTTCTDVFGAWALVFDGVKEGVCQNSESDTAEAE